MKRCYYEVLGVDREADEGDIKKAYRKVAFECHPDRNPDDQEAEERFKEASEAYEVLRDSDKRRLYDAYGHEGLQSSGFSGFGGVSDIFSAFSDIFEDFFGFGSPGGRRSRTRRGRDLRYDLELTLEEAAQGKEAPIEVAREVSCDQCTGTGMAGGAEPTVCTTCGGSGQVVRSQGFFRLATTCPACRGAGRVVSDPCPGCRGAGRVYQEKEINVRVPAGIEHGQRLRLRGEGEGGLQGGGPGDLYVVVQVLPHEDFAREGVDLYRQLEISFFQAALGARVAVSTLIDGQTALEVPAGSQFGDRLKLKGLGMPRLQGGKRGNLYVQLVIRAPRKLNRKQRALLSQAAALGDKHAAATLDEEQEPGEDQQRRVS